MYNITIKGCARFEKRINEKMTNREKAKELLYAENYTCVFTDGSELYTSTRRGVSPLLYRYDSGTDYTGWSAADKVIGRGAAFMYILLGIKDIYVKVISRPSLELLKSHGIEVEYDSMVPAIKNRNNTGFCPIESCVKDVADSDLPAALERIRKRTAELARSRQF